MTNVLLNTRCYCLQPLRCRSSRDSCINPLPTFATWQSATCSIMYNGHFIFH